MLCVCLSPLSIVSITVALKLGVNAGLVDSAPTFLDFSERPTPVIVTLIVTTNPVTKRSSIYFEKEIAFVSHLSLSFWVSAKYTDPTHWGC